MNLQQVNSILSTELTKANLKKYIVEQLSQEPEVEKVISDLAPFLKVLSRNGFENNFKAMTSSNIGTNLEIPKKFQPKDRRK